MVVHYVELAVEDFAHRENRKIFQPVGGVVGADPITIQPHQACRPAEPEIAARIFDHWPDAFQQALCSGVRNKPLPVEFNYAVAAGNPDVPVRSLIQKLGRTLSETLNV